MFDCDGTLTIGDQEVRAYSALEYTVFMDIAEQVITQFMLSETYDPERYERLQRSSECDDRSSEYDDRSSECSAGSSECDDRSRECDDRSSEYDDRSSECRSVVPGAGSVMIGAGSVQERH